MRTFLALALGAAAAVVAQKPDLEIKGTFGDANPFSKVVNGQTNNLYLTLENHSAESLVVKQLSGAWSEKVSASSGNEKFLKNSTVQSRLAVPVPAKTDGAFQPPTVLTYQFWSEHKPRELLFTAYVDYADAAGRTYRDVAYEGQVTVVEAPGSWFDPALLFAYAMLFALLGGAGYLAYNLYMPQQSKKRRTQPVVIKEETITAVDPDEWIPVHMHKGKKAAGGGGVTSGEESGAEGYASEKSVGGTTKSRKRTGKK